MECLSVTVFAFLCELCGLCVFKIIDRQFDWLSDAPCFFVFKRRGRKERKGTQRPLPVIEHGRKKKRHSGDTKRETCFEGPERSEPEGRISGREGGWGRKI